LAGRGIKVERGWAGTFLSALEMAGISLTAAARGRPTAPLARRAAHTSAWPALSGRIAQVSVRPAPAEPERASGATLSREATLRRVIEAVCACLLKAEPALTDMDQRVGDGRSRHQSFAWRGAVLQELDGYPAETISGAVLRGMSATLRRVVGGTSGPLYAVMLVRAAVALERSDGSDAEGMGGGVQRGCRRLDGTGRCASRRSHDGRCIEAGRRRVAIRSRTARRHWMPR